MRLMKTADLFRYAGMLVLVYALVYIYQTGFGILKAVFLACGIVLYIAGLVLKEKS